MSQNAIISVEPLDFVWSTKDPFLFCVYHNDNFPPGNDKMGPAASLAGRQIGNDFVPKDGWRMYHGETVPGFPAHPHRGFETVTVVMEGLVDHFDSHKQTGRYGNGDVQWMTAGKGLQHSEMFPLLDKENDNPMELFQIWLNLPRKSKFAEPHFKMLWNEDIPVVSLKDAGGRETKIRLVTGKYGETKSPEPAPDSWAADPANEVMISTIIMQPGATFVLPSIEGEVNSSLFFYVGTSVSINDTSVQAHSAVHLNRSRDIVITNGSMEARFLLLQGRPINEPVVQYGPFVMNSPQEIQQAYMDFQKTQFGGWPWSQYDVVHPREQGRFARHSDGREEIK